MRRNKQTMKCSIPISVVLACVFCTGIANAGDVDAGKASSSTCVGCHGQDGIGLGPEYPNLAGQKEAYLAKQMQAFRSGARKDPSMQAMVANLRDTDIGNLAAYYASLPASPAVATAGKAAITGRASALEFPETVFVTMKKGGTVETFPDEVHWDGGPNMLYNAVTPDRKYVLATSPSSNTVYVFSAASGRQQAVIPVGKAPKGVKIDPAGRFAYVSNEGSAELSVIDLARLVVVDTIKVEEGPHNVRFTKNGKLAYVTLQGGAGIGVVDTAARKQVRVIPVPGITGPHNIDLSADEKTAYVRDFVHHVAVVDLRSGEVKKVIKVGNGHGGIDVAPNGRYVATAAIGANSISVIDTDTLAVNNVEVGSGPHGIRASKDSRWIYATVTKDNVVAVIDAGSLQVVKKIAVGEFPFWVAVQGNP